MMKKLILPLALISLGFAQASEQTQATDDKNFSYKGGIFMGGTYVNSEHNDAKLLSLGIRGDLEYLLAPNLTGMLGAGFVSSGGSSESVYNSEFSKNSNFFLSEGYLSFNPLSDLAQLEFGLINQGRYRMPLLIGGGAFPAVIESSKIDLSKVFAIKASLQQSIPNTSTKSNRLDEVKEGTPFLHLERIGIQAKKSNLKADLSFTHFEYSNLSREVANQSRFFGNSISGSGDLSEFLYGFAGYYSQLDLGLSFGFYDLELNLNYLFNDKAPDGQNEALSLQLDHRFKFEGFVLELVTEIFRNEENASVAFYNDGKRGHSRRKGYGVELKMEFPKYKLKTSFNYIKAKVLGTSLYTSDMDFASLNITREF